MFITGFGLGLNDVDADSYVLKAYDSKQDSILHSFWTVGAFVGSAILAFTMTRFSSYKLGFVIILMIFIFVIIILFFAKRNWEKKKILLDEEIVKKHSVTEEEKNVNIFAMLKIKNMPSILICFGLVSAISRSITVFIATIMVEQYGLSEIVAASIVGYFCFAGFVGRIVCGFISDRFTLKSILIFGIFAEALIYMLLFFNVFTGLMLVFLMIVLGVFESILIPFIYSYAKEAIETNALSALFGYGNVFGLICAVTASGIATIIIQNISIRYIEIMYIILLGMLFLFLMRIKRKMQKISGLINDLR